MSIFIGLGNSMVNGSDDFFYGINSIQTRPTLYGDIYLSDYYLCADCSFDSIIFP